MNIIVHQPKDPLDIGALRKKTAEVHAEAVLKYVNKLTCTKEQKIKLIEWVIKELKPFPSLNTGACKW